MEMESMQKDVKILALEERIKDYKENLAVQEEKGAKLSKLYELGVINERGKLISRNSELRQLLVIWL